VDKITKSGQDIKTRKYQVVLAGTFCRFTSGTTEIAISQMDVQHAHLLCYLTV